MIPASLTVRSSCRANKLGAHARWARRTPALAPPLALAFSTSRAIAQHAAVHEPYLHANSHSYTHLPTPLPMDVRDRHASLRRRGAMPDGEADLVGTSPESVERVNIDEVYFPTSRNVETYALFQACLSSGLISRAHKLMQEMRSDAHTRLKEVYEVRNGEINVHTSPVVPLKLWSYNAMLQAYFNKAAHPDTTDTKVWVNYAWQLWKDMMAQSPLPLDPQPDASTIAAMATGIAHLEALDLYPSGKPTFEHLLQDIRTLGVSLDAVFSSSVWQLRLPSTGQSQASAAPDESQVSTVVLLAHFRSAATKLGDARAQEELDKIEQVLTTSEQRTAAENDATEVGMEDRHIRPVLKKDTVTDTMVKPFNLQTLQESLATMELSRRRSSDLYERQQWLEHSALDAARKRLEHDTENLQELGIDNGPFQNKTLQAWMWDWYQKVEEALRKDIQRIGRQTEHKVATTLESQLYPYLCLLPPSKMAMLVILELLRMQGVNGVADGIKSTRALISIGKAVETEYSAVMMNKHPEIFVQARAVQQRLGKRNLLDMAVRRDLKAWHDRCRESNMESNIPKWTQLTRARVGGFLVQHLMDVATVHRKAYDRDGELWEEEQPAFYSAYEYIQGKKLGVIRLNEVVSERLEKGSVRETLHPRWLPMLVPPRPWLSHDSGGYFSVRTSAMRFKDSVEQNSYLRAASENNGLEVIFAGLDVLGNTAWNINKEVFDVVLQVWNSGEAIADLPPSETTDPEPERPPPDDIKAKALYLQRLRKWNSLRSANHSQRCDVNYKLEIANCFLNERFYFPHNMDFRGRAYPIPPNLNHIGNDLCRGLLKFADAKPLGQAGYRWLRIHLANVWGYDKASFAEREKFTDDHKAQIYDAATNPLGGERWWLQADDPWQCLATCFELYKAWEYPEGPEAFPSQMPVHQDGTCNGLQHYAALGGDLQGAKQVNLRGGDRPADVYTGVAELVIAKLERDAVAGDEIAQKLRGKITRKVVKQTVMTTVYGVTYIGAKNQVMRQLADRGDTPVEDLWISASYLAKAIMECIGDLFSGANMIQDWLTMTARLISKSIPPERVKYAQMKMKKRRNMSDPKGTSEAKQHTATTTREAREQMTSVIWTTALGLPIVQPYRRIKKNQIMTAVQSVYIRDPNQHFEVNTAKQASAFPPNFIHSLDATHMYLTALECHSAGLVFASVHDSYWTHACDIDTMGDIIRDTFVRLHSQDILVRLRDEFLHRYKGYKVPASSLHYDAKSRSKRAAKAAESDEAENDEQDTPLDITSLNRWAKRDANGFYELADLLPPIPKKGDFDVSEIKRSLYFFS